MTDKAKRLGVVLAALFSALLLFLPQPAYATNDTVVKVVATADYGAASDQLEYTNKYRAANGLSSLVMDKHLQNYAMTRAAECALYYSHTRPNNTSANTILTENGYRCSSWGENIAAGQTLAYEVTQDWISSEGHRANILNSNFTAAGIGCVRVDGYTYWCQIFANKSLSAGEDGSGLVAYSFSINVDYDIVSFDSAVFNPGGDSSDPLLLKPGDTYNLGVYFKNPETKRYTPTYSASYTWTSSDTSAATVSSNGVVTIKDKPGATVTVTAKSADGHTWTRRFKVRIDLSHVSISSLQDQVYSNDSYNYKSILPTLTYNGTRLVKNTDYTVQEPGRAVHLNAGDVVKLTITGTGAYCGETTVSYKILPMSLADVKLDPIDDQTYTGSAIEPEIDIRVGQYFITEGTDYVVSYSNNVNPGTATATVRGIGNYTGSTSVTFTITRPSYKVSFASQGGSSVPSQSVKLNDTASRPTNPTRSGYTFAGWYTSSTGGSLYDFSSPVTRDMTLYARWTQSTQTMHRLYNRWTGEHFYTASTAERDNLVSLKWTYEGVGWVAPTSGTPVYRLYNRYVPGGDHHYTTSSAERDALVRVGWTYEGVGWYSGGSVPVYRQYNPYATTGTHNYTTNKSENDYLVSVGWRYEGVGWYAVSAK